MKQFKKMTLHRSLGWRSKAHRAIGLLLALLLMMANNTQASTNPESVKSDTEKEKAGMETLMTSDAQQSNLSVKLPTKTVCLCLE